MTTKEVAEKYNLSDITVRKWARENNIKRKMMPNGMMGYNLTEADCRKFDKREKKTGWKKGRPRSKKRN
jgi:uncharacterized protein YjcR